MKSINPFLLKGLCASRFSRSHVTIVSALLAVLPDRPTLGMIEQSAEIAGEMFSCIHPILDGWTARFYGGD
jgi:hypothetical protein